MPDALKVLRKENGIFFTVVDPYTQKETRINFETAKTLDAVTIKGYNHFEITVDRQQLSELGYLFLSLAGEKVDLDSSVELIEEGYKFPLPVALELQKD